MLFYSQSSILSNQYFPWFFEQQQINGGMYFESILEQMTLFLHEHWLFTIVMQPSTHTLNSFLYSIYQIHAQGGFGWPRSPTEVKVSHTEIKPKTVVVGELPNYMAILVLYIIKIAPPHHHLTSIFHGDIGWRV